MTSNPNSPDFNYKDYALEKLQEWIHDAMSGDASPHEIYSAIREAVREDYYYHKDYASRAGGLLELLSGHRPVSDNDKELFRAAIAERDYYEGVDRSVISCDKNDKSPECQKAWNDFWEENYYPEEHKQYTEEELNAMCDKAASDQLSSHQKHIGWKEMSDSEFDRMFPPKDKVVKWRLPVEVVKDEDTDKDEYYVTFPDDLLEAANLKEGDTIEWVDQGDGSYLLKKLDQPSWVEGNELAKSKTYDEMISEGWTMTDDGFWIKDHLSIDQC